MPDPTRPQVTLTLEAARALAQRAMEKLGYSAADAGIIADHVMDAELCGYGYSGLSKILNVAEHPRSRQPRRAVRVVKENSISALVDGGNNSGMLAVYRATEIAIRKARGHGAAIVAVFDCFHSGRNAYFVEMIAKTDLIGIHLVSSGPLVAPPGGARPVLGTNPIAFGIPTAHGPLVFDMGTSAMAGSDLFHRCRINEMLPEGVAIDAGGMPTRDPHEALKGSLLNFGGYKGFGLSLCIQALGFLAGASSDIQKYEGFLLLALDPGLFVPLDQFKAETSGLVARVKSVPRQPDVQEIRIPSERAFRERAQRLQKGVITIEKSVYDYLNALTH